MNIPTQQPDDAARLAPGRFMVAQQALARHGVHGASLAPAG